MWARDYVGIPYLSKGSSFMGADCYGLFRLIKAMQENVKIPEYEYDSAEDMESIETAMIARLTWTKHEKPAEGMLVIINIAGQPVHCGYVLDENNMLHSLKGHNSAIERFTSKKWKDRVEGFYSYG